MIGELDVDFYNFLKISLSDFPENDGMDMLIFVNGVALPEEYILESDDEWCFLIDLDNSLFNSGKKTLKVVCTDAAGNVSEEVYNFTCIKQHWTPTEPTGEE